MAHKLYHSVCFGQSAFLGGGKIVNSAEHADMFSTVDAALAAIRAWHDGLPDTPENFRIQFDLVNVMLITPDTENTVDGEGLKDHSLDNRG